MSLSVRAAAEHLAQGLPALLASAEHLAATITYGDHGRRRAGAGEGFWQFRPAQIGDAMRQIDWRRSGRGDQAYVRETEWQSAQSVMIWIDQARSMDYASRANHPSKGDRARLLGLALAILLLRGGERVGWAGGDAPARSGRAQIEPLVQALIAQPDPPDYGTPDATALLPHGRAVFLSDFLGDMDQISAALGRAADRGVRGVMVHILDPAEEDFPFAGRTLFQSMSGHLEHETLQAQGLRSAYLDRLVARKARLADLAQSAGWQYHDHQTGQAAQPALLWAYRALEGKA